MRTFPMLSQVIGIMIYQFYLLILQSEEDASEAPSSEPQLVVWGTDVAIAECRDKFVKFIQRFVEPNAVINEPLYEQKLEEVSDSSTNISEYV